MASRYSHGELHLEELRREPPRELLELRGELGGEILLDGAGVVLVLQVERERLPEVEGATELKAEERPTGRRR